MLDRSLVCMCWSIIITLNTVIDTLGACFSFHVGDIRLYCRYHLGYVCFVFDTNVVEPAFSTRVGVVAPSIEAETKPVDRSAADWSNCLVRLAYTAERAGSKQTGRIHFRPCGEMGLYVTAL